MAVAMAATATVAVTTEVTFETDGNNSVSICLCRDAGEYTDEANRA